MLKMKFDIAAPDDVESARISFSQKLAKSSLEKIQANFLSEQVGITLNQFEQHFKSKSDNYMNADRIFEGDGYSIKIAVRCGRVGFFNRLAKAIGFS